MHGYDESFKAVWANPVTGAAPLVWDRAVGWYFLSLWEALQVFPQSHAGYQKLLGYFTTLAAALKKTQDDASGGWWLIMSEPYPGAAGNYIESSASAMFVLGLLRGVRSGYLASAEYLAPAQTGYQALVDTFVVENADGTLDWEGTVEVGSLGSNGTYEVSFGQRVTPSDSRFYRTDNRYSTTSASRSLPTTTRAPAHSCWRPTSGKAGLRALNYASTCRSENIYP